MKEWKNRSQEVAIILNPAFCAYLITTSLKAYLNEDENGAPFLFPFILLPLVLHKPTRDVRPRAVKTSFSTWMIEEASIVKVGFDERAKNLVPYVREAIIFGINNECFSINKKGFFIHQQTPRKPKNMVTSNEVESCSKASQMFGKWFAGMDYRTIMTLLGVRP